MTSVFHRIHKYLIGDQINKGRFASVRVCFKKNCDKPLCAKLINKASLAKYHETHNIIFNERYLAPLIIHPNVIEVIDVFDSQRTIFQITQLYQNGSLLNVLQNGYETKDPSKKYERLDFDQKLRITCDILSAIHFLHNHFICHRDIKLENVIVTDTLQAKLCDFGLAVVTFDGNVKGKCGSYHYAAPECLKGQIIQSNGQNNTYNAFTSDMWSLGVLLFAFYSHRFPYPNLDKDFSYDIEPNYQLLPEQLRPIIQSLLNKDPTKRPTINEIIQLDLFAPHIKLYNGAFSSEFHNFAQSLRLPIFHNTIDAFTETRISQMLNLSFNDTEKNLLEEGFNIPKLFYHLFYQRVHRFTKRKASFNSSLNDQNNVGQFSSLPPPDYTDDFKHSIPLTPSSSCPSSLSGKLTMKTYKASSKDVMKYVHNFVTSRNGCISEPITENREIVLNGPTEDLVLSFDFFDVESDSDNEDQTKSKSANECDILLTSCDFSNELLFKLSEAFEEVERENLAFINPPM